jgi:DNA-binding transcriptional MerR regulator
MWSNSTVMEENTTTLYREEVKTVVSITEAAELSGLPPDDIRHYEAEGVIPRAERGASGRRVFRAEEVRRLRLIRHVRDLGIPIQDIKRLLWGNQRRRT